MGFSQFEKDSFRALCRSKEKIDSIIDEYYPTELVEFLKEQVKFKLHTVCFIMYGL